MHFLHRHRLLFRDTALTVSILSATILICIGLSYIFNDNNSFSVPVFILAIALISRLTGGYVYGIAASIFSVICVNYMFTYPFFEFNLSISGYPLTFTVMLLVSVIISALTTQIKKQEQLRYEVEKEKMRANLLRSVSHDIRTPLASILGSSSTLLENEALPPALRNELLHDIHKEAGWLVRVTENILSVTKFSGDDVVLKKSDEVLEEIIGSAIVKFRKNRDVIPIHVTRPEEILLVPMDATLIEQVILNLLENVVAHAQTATKIELEVRREKNQVFISVSDDGIGLPETLLEKIRAGDTLPESRRTEQHRNMGIGLAVCNSIIAAHGGELDALNNKDGGATFSFWLPAG